MGSNFAKVRKKTRITAILTSLAIGLLSGVLAASVLLLVMKLSATQMQPLYYALCGVLAALISTVLYFLLMPSDKKLAKRLDVEYKLKEKMRTMVEFQNSDNDFVRLQRADADEKLGKVSFSPWKKGRLIALLVLLLVAAAMLLTAILVPYSDATDPEDPLSEFDKEWILTELRDIINTVDTAPVADSLKTAEVAELQALVEFVEANEYLSKMKLEAIKSVIKIDKMLTAENTATLIGEKLAACSNTTLVALGGELVKLNGSGVQKNLKALKDELENMSPDNIVFVADELSAAITASGANTASPFTELLSNFALALRGYAAGSVDTIDDALSSAAVLDAMNNTMVQSVNKMITQTVISRLCSLFGISSADLDSAGADTEISTDPPKAPGSDSDSDADDDKSQNIGAGGIGTGDRIYGSTDMIYNPYTNEYVPYGEIFDEYNNKVLQMVKDGLIPPDFEEFTTEYFRSLSEYNPNT